MKWNHRLICDRFGLWGIHRCYYNDNGSLHSYVSADIRGESLQDFDEQLASYLKALEKPALCHDDFKQV